MRKSYAQSFFNPFVYIYNEVQRWLRKTLYNNEAIYFRQNVTLFINSSRQRVLDFTGKSCRSFNNNLHTEQQPGDRQHSNESEQWTYKWIG